MLNNRRGTLAATLAARWRAAAAFLGLLVAPPAHAEVRALIAGVWNFNSPVIPNLKGPENDVAAMETLVRNEGASDVTVLRNDQVTRTTLETALHALGLRARPGDWIVLYYSGHGAEAEAAVKGTRDGDRDQFLPLAGFDLDAQDVERFIVDKDFYDWLSRYVRPDVHVLMIADTCHSGTMNRAVNPRAFHFTPRVALRGMADEMKLIARPAPRFASVLPAGRDIAGPVDRADLPNLVYIGGAQDDQLALESSLPNEGAPARGLMTYAFEQGLTRRGADGKALLADLDGDGKVTMSEIAVYLDGQVRMLSAQQQQPRVAIPAGREGEGLFATKPMPAPAISALPRVYAADPAAQPQLRRPDAPWLPAATADAADFIWDYGGQRLIRRTGDAVAEAIATSARLRGAIEKWNAVTALAPLMNEARGHLGIGTAKPGGRLHPGATVVVDYAGQPGAGGYVTVFNLAGDGTVQVLYPLGADDGAGQLDPSGNLPLLRNKVVPPFGVDHVIALVTPAEPIEFRKLLRTLDNQRAAAQVVDPIRKVLAAAPGQATLSVAEIYTGTN